MDLGNNNQTSAANRPWMPCLGNHEVEFDNGAQGFTSYLTRYTLPDNQVPGFGGRWYSFRIGSVLFVSLDADDVVYQDAGAFVAGPAALTPVASTGNPPIEPGTSLYVRGYSGGAQTAWLQRTLAAGRGDPSVDWIIVQMHQCACSSSSTGNGSDLGIRQQWLPLFDRYGVDLVLNHICHRVRGQFGDGEHMNQNLTIARGAALYIGAILGPGLLLLPGLAAAVAGPASIVAWLALLGLSGLFAAVFSALGRRNPSAGGVVGYVTAGLGSRAGRATGWMFLAGVVGGAPIVCLIGASYVTDLTGGGQLARAAVAAGLLMTVIGLAAGGLRASAAAQLALVSLLTVVVVVAVAGSAPAARAGNWTPFTPHGCLSVGSEAATLMFSFVGWEAVAPLTTRFAHPSRQLPAAVAIALMVTTALYLGLAIATISVLGPRAATDVPLAGLLSHAVGSAGPDIAAVAAIVLTLGATNAYISGAAAMAGRAKVAGYAAPPGRQVGHQGKRARRRDTVGAWTYW
jgi:Amino acid permease/Calcineurin-like phosphoesterase